MTESAERATPVEPITLGGLSVAELTTVMGDFGARPFHARQLFRWLYAHRVDDFGSMTDLGQGLRRALADRARFGFPRPVERLRAADDTLRVVYELDDHLRTESVYIPGRPGRATLCLSSQVGCALACRFCLSGANGLKRDLSAAEIVGQAWTLLREAPPLERVNVVFMGIGEPLDNFDTVVRVVALLTDGLGFAIPARRITVSTAGHVPAILRLASVERRPRLAISLNATTDEVRSQLMPINKAWPLAELLGALRSYPLRTNERVTFEYVLLAGVNDFDEDARRLGRLVHGIPAKINLIPWNPSLQLPFTSPTPERLERFQHILEQQAAAVTVRRRRGGDVAAACGQLSFLPRPRAAPAAP